MLKVFEFGLPAMVSVDFMAALVAPVHHGQDFCSSSFSSYLVLYLLDNSG